MLICEESKIKMNCFSSLLILTCTEHFIRIKKIAVISACDPFIWINSKLILSMEFCIHTIFCRAVVFHLKPVLIIIH